MGEHRVRFLGRITLYIPAFSSVCNDYIINRKARIIKDFRLVQARSYDRSNDCLNRQVFLLPLLSAITDSLNQLSMLVLLFIRAVRW